MIRSVWLLLCALGFAFACSRSGPSHDRVIVLGLDGVDPQVVDLLMSEGKLPNFAKLRQGGAYGKLESSKPLLSPIVWTTIATGKTPLQHGISHFVAVNAKTGAELPVTSQMRRVKALWNVLSGAGREVAVVGWWATWPAENVLGVVVSDHTCYHFLFNAGESGSRDPLGLTHPPELVDEIAPLVRRPGDLKAEDLARFVDVTPEQLARPFNFQDDLSHFKWALATAQSYREIGLQLWKQRRPDVELVYIEGTDSTSHLFGHLFRRSDLSGPLAEQGRRYGHAVEEMYRYADELVGAYLDAMEDDTTLLVLSDHGFELGVLHEDPSRARDLRRVSERFHRVEGILYLYGNRVRAGRRLEKPAILDIAPTVLALAGVPPAADMPGRVLSEGLDLPPELTSTPRSVESYETGEAGAATAEAKADADVSPEILEHLRALGYLDASSPKGDRNLAALHFEKGDYAEAARLYSDLVRASPDDAGLRASYAGALGALGKLDQAFAELGRAIALEPANPEAYHNRGAILEKRGDPKAAAREYQTALRYAPDYEPSRTALARLGGGAPTGDEPKTANEKLAMALAEQAHQAALRDDFAGATQKLDEAERRAPRFALVAHYRANIAWLRGDRAGAIKAMRRAVELEPDNPLFRTNLERLEAAGQAGAVVSPPGKNESR